MAEELISPVSSQPPRPPGLEAIDLDYDRDSRSSVDGYPRVRHEPFTKDTMVVSGSEQPATRKVQQDAEYNSQPGFWASLQDGFMDFLGYLLNDPVEEDAETELIQDQKTGSGQGAAHPSPAKRHNPTRWLEQMRWQNDARSSSNADEFWANLNADKILAMAFKGVDGLEREVIQDRLEELRVFYERQGKIRQDYFRLTDTERKALQGALKTEALKHGSKIVTNVLLVAAAIASANPVAMATVVPLALINLGQSTFHFLPKRVQTAMVGNSKPGQAGYIKGMLQTGMGMFSLAGDSLAMLAPTVLPGVGAAKLLATAVSASAGLGQVTSSGAKMVFDRKQQLLGAERKDVENRSRKNTGRMKSSAEKMSKASQSIGEAAQAAVRAEETRTRAIQDMMRVS